MRHFRSLFLALMSVLAIEGYAFATLAPEARDRMTTSGKVGSDVIARLNANGTSPVTIAFDMPQEIRPTGDGDFDLAAWNAAVDAARVQLLSALDAADFVSSYQYRSVAAIAGVASADGILKLLDTGKVVRVDVDAIAQATLTQAVPFVHLDATQALGFTGTGVTVAVTDTGIDAQHPDFAGAIDGEECFCLIGSHGCCPDGSSRESGPGSAADDDFHGTWTSGIIAGRGVTAPRGGAPGAHLFALKVLNRDGEGETSGIVAALDWLLNTRPDIKLVNMSLGSSSFVFDGDCDDENAFTMMYRDAINALRSTGATVFAASGNSYSIVYMNAPGCIHNAVSVAASYDNDPQNLTYGPCENFPETPDNVACFSSVNHTTDLAAPGVNITAANLGGGAVTKSGTSASAPMVTACAAALREAAPSLSSLELELALKSVDLKIHDFRSTQQFPPDGIDLPRLDCVAAVSQVLAGRGLCPVSPRSTCEHSEQAQSSGFKFTAYPAPDKRDTLNWSWKRGAIPAIDLGSPTDTTSYSLCVYDGTSGLLVNLFAPASGICGGKACWKHLSLGAGGFKYADRLLTPSGISFMRMGAGSSAAGRLQVKGKGQNLALPRGHVTLPVRVQLINEANSKCWEATFTTPKVNTTGSGVPSGKFSARGQ